MKDIMKMGIDAVLLQLPKESQEEKIDYLLCSITHHEMIKKLEVAREKGRCGWWKEECNIDFLKDMLREHIEKGDMIDVINIAAMIMLKEEGQQND